MEALWRYMGTMYSLDAFKTSCPADQDIISHYRMQQVHDEGGIFFCRPKNELGNIWVLVGKM